MTANPTPYPPCATFEEFVATVGRWIEYSPHERRGQYAFNLLSATRKDIAKQIVPLDIDKIQIHLDPFNNDDRLPAFMEFVGTNW